MRTNRKTRSQLARQDRRNQNLPFLALEDLAGYTEEDVINHFLGEYKASQKEVEPYRVLIAYESVGSWGCDSSSWFLLQDRKTGKLYETHGSHCSCYGFEGQFAPEETTPEYLWSDHFHFSTGGYDINSDGNKDKAKEYLKKYLGKLIKR